MATELELFVGTYEEFLLSYKIKQSHDDGTFIMERFVTNRIHNSPILCMDTYGRYLATGGGDDRIVIVDLKLNKDIQMISTHKASINALSFTSDGSHLLSGSEDGQLIATKVGSWIKENIWNKPHTGKAILKISIHVSGKIAFTLGKDGTLRAWDMIKGRQVSTSNVRDFSKDSIILDNIQLCPNGRIFAMSGSKIVTILSTVGSKMYDELELPSQVTCMCWIDDENLLIGTENGSIEWTNITDEKHENIPNVHAKRVKGMHYVNGFLATICSTGDLTLWATLIPEKRLTLICTTNAQCRPICVRLINTTLNRYKGELKIETDEVKETVADTGEKSKRINTVGKVTIEVNECEENQPHDDIRNKKKTKVTSHKELEIVSNVTPTKKSKIFNSNGKEQSPLSAKKLTVSAKKRIVVSSQNSEDDFVIDENSKKELKTNSQKELKTNSQKELKTNSQKELKTNSQKLDNSTKKRKLSFVEEFETSVLVTPIKGNVKVTPSKSRRKSKNRSPNVSQNQVDLEPHSTETKQEKKRFKTKYTAPKIENDSQKSQLSTKQQIQLTKNRSQSISPTKIVKKKEVVKKLNLNQSEPSLMMTRRKRKPL